MIIFPVTRRQTLILSHTVPYFRGLCDPSFDPATPLDYDFTIKSS